MKIARDASKVCFVGSFIASLIPFPRSRLPLDRETLYSSKSQEVLFCFGRTQIEVSAAAPLTAERLSRSDLETFLICDHRHAGVAEWALNAGSRSFNIDPC
jgi:hypothetical protein